MGAWQLKFDHRRRGQGQTFDLPRQLTDSVKRIATKGHDSPQNNSVHSVCSGVETFPRLSAKGIVFPHCVQR